MPRYDVQVVLYVCGCVAFADLKVVRSRYSILYTEEGGWDTEKQTYGSYKAERVLYFTARSLALAGWADLEALVDFYEAMLEV